MQQFNLDTWLKDKSRKVIDDDGFPVEIIKWDANEKCPVVYLNHNGIAYNVSVDGMYDSDPNHGLFFADEEENLSEDERIRKEIISFITDTRNWFPKEETKSSWIAWLEKQGEQKPSWNEEDEKFLNYSISLTDDAQIKNFLKSLKDRVQPHPKQEWSEEDDIRLDHLIGLIQKDGLNYYESIDKVIDIIHWLKSIKPHWKPSEEQMEALKKRTHGLHTSSETRKALESLINDLKTL